MGFELEVCRWSLKLVFVIVSEGENRMDPFY